MMQKLSTKQNISEYRDALKRIFFKQGDSRKFNEKTFLMEIEAAAHYGAVCALQNLLLEKELTADELRGEAQIKMLESYDKVKKILAIRLPKIQLGDLLRGEG
jgi:hypothetical protein